MQFARKITLLLATSLLLALSISAQPSPRDVSRYISATVTVRSKTAKRRIWLPMVPAVTTYYVSASGSGTACTIGSPCTLAFATGGGSSPVQPGDTVELATGIYSYVSVTFSPAGTSQPVMTTFKAAAGARPIITSTTNTPPTINMRAYMRLAGLCYSGT